MDIRCGECRAPVGKRYGTLGVDAEGALCDWPPLCERCWVAAWKAHGTTRQPYPAWRPPEVRT